MLVYTGGKVTSIDASGCQTGAVVSPLQQAVLVDPDAIRGSRTVSIITVSPTDPVPPGTRLGSIAFLVDCTLFDGTSHKRYTGIVQ